MNYSEGLKSGLTEILSHKLRSLLTMLGVVLGVTAVVAMVSITEGAQLEAIEQFKMIGVNTIEIQRKILSSENLRTAGKKSTYGLLYGDALAVRNVFPRRAQVACSYHIDAQISNTQKIPEADIVGVTPNFLSLERLSLMSGRHITAGDINSFSPVCLIGPAIKKALFGFDNPIGKTLRIENSIFTVIGVLNPKNLKTQDIPVALQSTDTAVFVPLSTAMALLKIKTGEPQDLIESMQKLNTPIDRWENYPVSTIKIQVDDGEPVLAFSKVVDSTLKRRHQGVEDYTIVIPSEILKFKQKTQHIFNIIMGAIAGISLLVGGIGIMNIMLATITQRVPEIGIRRCVGATRKEILFQFLIECLLLTVIGGFIGIALGALTAKFISLYAQWKTLISLKAVLLSFGVALAVGLIFGLYPARQASLINPIEALRGE